MAHYIIDYEGVETDSEDNLNDKMEAFMIDVPSLTLPQTGIKNIKAFITSFGAMDHAEIIISNLANQSFEHSLTGTGPVTYNDTIIKADLDPFTYIATERYNSNKFYRTMINTGAFKHLTAGYGQYLA